jgi:hypothetical protein
MFSPFGFMGSQAAPVVDEYYFNFDFTSGDSYPGSGTSIYDLSNNYTGSIEGSLSYNAGTGYFTFNQNAANYINVPHNSNMNYTGNIDSGLTMIMWAKNTDTGGIDGYVFRKGWWNPGNEDSQGSYGVGKGFGTDDYMTSEFVTNVANGDNLFVELLDFWQPNAWKLVVMTMEYDSLNSRTTGSVWLNNVEQTVVESGSPGAPPYIPGYVIPNDEDLQIGKARSTSTAWKGDIAVVKAYKGLWTATEVNDYWLATKSRFGL